jgi:hypothetical protein
MLLGLGESPARNSAASAVAKRRLLSLTRCDLVLLLLLGCVWHERGVVVVCMLH